MKLDDLKLEHLKAIAREHKLKGFSTMARLPLVKHIKKHLGAKLKIVDGKPSIAPKAMPKSKGGSVIATAEKPKAEGAGPDVSDRLRKLIDRLKGGAVQAAEGKEGITNVEGGKICMPMRGGAVKEKEEEEGDDDPIDWDDIKWGSFTEQLKRYNATHKKKFLGDKALCNFADMIIKNKSKYSTKTQRRASFYLNVLAKKKCA